MRVPGSLLFGRFVIDALDVGHEDGKVGADVDADATGEAVVVGDVQAPSHRLSVLGQTDSKHIIEEGGCSGYVSLVQLVQFRYDRGILEKCSQDVVSAVFNTLYTIYQSLWTADTIPSQYFS